MHRQISILQYQYGSLGHMVLLVKLTSIEITYNVIHGPRDCPAVNYSKDVCELIISTTKGGVGIHTTYSNQTT